jgi:hypothetical protein
LRESRAFTDWTDVLHAALGLLCAALRKLWWWAALAIMVAFIAYEALQGEPRVASYEDYVEFITGFVLGLVLFP